MVSIGQPPTYLLGRELGAVLAGDEKNSKSEARPQTGDKRLVDQH